MHDRLLRRLQQKRARNDKGMTLVELLVVITVLGILAAIVVVAVSGIGDKGKAAAATTESDILRVAQETYCTTNGSYGNMQELRAAEVIERDPGYFGTVSYTDPVAGNGACGGERFYVGPTSIYTGGDSADPLFYSASNNTFPWSFLAPEFINRTDSNGKPVNGSFRVRFDSSGTLGSATRAPGDTAALFASADTANVLATVPTGTPTAAGVGTCPATSICRGIASTVTKYTVGQLVMFSCRSGGVSLPPADGGSKRCNKPPALTGQPQQYLPNPPQTVADLVARINADSSFRVVIPSGGAAPYGAAAAQALTNAGLALPHPQINSAGGNVTQTQTRVLNGEAHVAFIPKSFVVSPGGNDTNNFVDVPPAQYDNPATTTVVEAIDQWGVVLDLGTADQVVTPTNAAEVRAQQFLAFLTSEFAQQALVNGYGYLRAIP